MLALHAIPTETALSHFGSPLTSDLHALKQALVGSFEPGTAIWGSIYLCVFLKAALSGPPHERIQASDNAGDFWQVLVRC